MAYNHKEYMKEYNKRYREKYRDKLNTKTKEWRKNNPNKIQSYSDRWTNKDYSVYLLPNCNYVGYTNCIERRMLDHKSRYKRDISSYRILHTTSCKEDALELEELLHDIGYEGRNKNY